MKRNFFNILAVLALIVSLINAVQPAFASGLAQQIQGVLTPSTISYQGMVKIAGQPYTGAGYFKFAVVNATGATTYWSNDGSSTAGSQPTSAVSLSVSDGYFTALLGDGMTPITAQVFAAPDRLLRIWFSSDGTSFTQLAPDRKIASVPYALQAEEAGNANTLDGQEAAAFSLITHNHNTLYIADNAQAVGDDDIIEDGLAPGSISGTAWTAATDGADSGLDADKLDGQHASAFALLGHNHDLLYASLGHNHNTLYAAISHNHDAVYQRRVSGTCPQGYAILEVLADGSVTCEAVQSRPIFSLSTLDSAGYVGIETAITIGADGLGLISYYDHSNTNLKVAHCNNTACTSATITTLDNSGSVGNATAITIGADGLGIISYTESTTVTTNNLKVAHCSNINCTAATITTLDNSGNVGINTGITIGSDGLVLISYDDETNGDLKVAHCGNIVCSSFAISTLDSTGIVGGHNAITIGADGLGLISYFDSTNNDLKVAHCANITCGSATYAALDSAINTGWYTSITIGVDGLGLISYCDNSNLNLKVAHCNDTTCTTATYATLDSIGNVGENSSITIGPDGLGLISYAHFGDSDLKVAHCSNITCSAATISVLESAGEVGKYTSLVIGTDGLGLISYYDETNSSLKVAHLSNILGTPWTRR